MSSVKEQFLTYMDENKKMINLHERDTNARLKNVEAQMGHLVQAFKEKFSRTSPNNTLTNPMSAWILR